MELQKGFLTLFLLSQLLFLCAYIFSKGFLLTRDSLDKFSTCDDFGVTQNNSDCLTSKKFNKLIYIVIDALRYDFVFYNRSESFVKQNHFENNLKSIYEKIQTNPHGSRLMKFIADPPTTTMQRLKGLTTGTLPTFIEVSKNFASSSIEEDNLIDQLIRQGKKLVVLGDDTWGNLFPGKFHRSMLASSFNVKDLHTVDNLIIKNLSNEINKNDWDVIIAHFLGVDHCGHTFGPNTSQMESKLKQMDKIIQDTANEMDEDTLLLVLGDHGMTSTGDHGGDSELELEAALFVHSKKKMFSKLQDVTDTVWQIDLVPTLSFLLGLPIPFSNIGKIIESMIDFNSPHGVANAYKLNAQQVHRYLSYYQSSTNEIDNDKWSQLENSYENFRVNMNDTSSSKFALSYLQIARMVCEESWAKFDLPLMAFALASLCLTIFSTLGLVTPLTMTSKWFTLLFAVCQIVFTIAFYTNFALVIIVPLVFLFVLYNYNSFSLGNLCNKDYVPVIVFCCGSFSNSYVLSELSSCMFLVISIVLYKTWYLLQGTNSLPSRANKSLRFKASKLPAKYMLVSLIAVLCILLRLGFLFVYCREEQYWCETNEYFHNSLVTLPTHLQNLRFFSSVLCISIWLYVVKHWLLNNGNISSSIPYIVGGLAPSVCFVCVIVQWVLDCYPSLKDRLPYFFLNSWFVYAIIICTYVYLIAKPLLIHTVVKESPYVSQAEIIPHIVSKLRNSTMQKTNDTKPMVFGLATGVSAAYAVMCCNICILFFILSSDGLALSSLVVVAASFVYLMLHSYFVLVSASSYERLFDVNRVSIVVWFLLSIHGFYGSGHQSTFPSIRWSAAFVGFDGSNHMAASLLTGINTFSSQFVHGFFLPLLFVVPFTVGALSTSIVSPSMKGKLDKGEYMLSIFSQQSKQCLEQSALIYVGLHAIKILFTSLTAFVLRRHLMVWKIFAPRFVFDVVGLGVTLVSVLLGQFLISRIFNAYDNWNNKFTITETVLGPTLAS